MKKKLWLELGLVIGIALILCAVFAREKVGVGTEETTAFETALSESETPLTETETAAAERKTAGEGETAKESLTEESGTETESAEAVPLLELPEPLVSDPGFVTDSDAYCVLDEDGRLIIGKNISAAYAPASITKVLTALVVLEQVSLQEQVTVREEELLSVDIMSSGVSPSLKAGEVFTVEDLLYALILPSTNAAGAVLAQYVAGSQEAFAELMNQKLRELGLSHSHFVNAHGLDADGHYVCAFDMCVILKAACENAELRKILGTVTYTMPATDYTEARSLVMGHRMVTGEEYLEGTFAGKPGGSQKAGNSLLTAVEQNGRTLYICTLHSDEGKQYEDTRNIAEKAFALLNGGSYQAASLIHDLRIDSVSGLELTASFSADNDPVKAVARIFDVAAGEESALYRELPLESEGTKTVSFSLPSYGTYELQVYLTGAQGEMTAISGRVLVTGSTLGPGMVQWNGNSYYVKANGFLYTGAAETPGGFYYAAADGRLLTGFAGKFYAGADYAIVTGWFTEQYGRYYAGADGRIVTGKALIGGTLYEFTDYGELIQ